MSESEKIIQQKIRLELSKYGIIIRINSGTGWTGNKIKKNKNGSITILDPRPLKNAVKGFPDLLFLGDDSKIAFIECKNATYKPSKEQINFMNTVRKMGYRAGIARSVEDALKIINKFE